MEFMDLILGDWSTEAARLRRWGAGERAEVIDRCAEQLRAATIQAGSELLAPWAAAEDCGYSTSQLSRLAKQGRLKNHGSRNRPKYRRTDLPRKKQSTRSTVARQGASVERRDEVLRDMLASSSRRQ
jgi:hypothetical protein